MGIRTVRLDDETEAVLREIQQLSDMPISTALKRGLRAVRDEVARTTRRSAWDVYAELDLGSGGYAKGPSTKTRETARNAILAKTRR